ncbi:MAG TPA: M1 family metallopeptidase [Candidatus Binatia bacterium]|nr:M1 family metallopeptidase [Candidatus Binatia bacterium]
MPEPKPHRLPTHTIPQRYQLRLAPDLKAWTFAGEENVSVDVQQPIDAIRVNAAELEFQSVTVMGAAGKALAATVTLDGENEQAIFTLPETLPPGSYDLQIQFSGILNDKLHGFYRSTYKDAQGNEKTLASTQFESTDARRAFPCWDEPAFKAVFQVTLVVDEGLTAISNARLVRENSLRGTGKKEVVFADSMKMSTYLVAFIVGNFERTDPVMADGVPLSVWAVPGKKNLAGFALEVGKASLEHFSQYYGISYPGDKLDLIAIPDFASGAMENLGAITFRETALLVDPEKAARAELERVADVVSHENAHMWFGDLVTMQWWNGLWLNEAFATFMEMLAVDAWKPEWRRWDSFTISRAAAMQVDGLKSTRPIEFPVEKPEEAAGMFDVLTYEKGASVLRMLEQYLGGDAFRDGIRLYLKRHAYANAETTDLWDALEHSTKQPVRALMDKWIFQPGYPLISVAHDAQGIILSQQIFRYLQNGSDRDRTWHVPIFLRAGTEGGIVEKTLLLTDREARVELPNANWVVVNAGGHGYYRVRYSGKLIAALKRGLQSDLSPVERFGLVNDTWASTLAGLTTLPDYLDLIDLLRDENDINVWSTAIASSHHLGRILSSSQRAVLEDRLRVVMCPVLERLGWTPKEGEPALVSQLRGDVIAALGTVAEEKRCQERARELYAEYEKIPESVEPNLVPALVAILAYTGTSAEYEKFYAKFKSAKTPQEETRYLFALAAFKPTELIDRTLKMTISGEVRTQNSPYLMRSILLNKDAREKAWDFMKTHWEEMTRQYPDNAIPRMCEGIIGLVSADLEKDVRRFFAEHPVKQGEKQMEQHLERLHIAVTCQERWRDVLVP